MTLSCSSLVVRASGTDALRNVNLRLQQGNWLLVLGPNGGGKSTLAGAVSGRVPVSSGTIEHDGVDVAKASIRQRVQRGIVEVTEGRNLFPTMQVHEHLTMAHRAGEWSVDDVEALFPELARRRKNLAYSLSGGEQQMLAIARGLVCQPTLFVLDEPTTGLAPLLRRRVCEVLETVAASGTSILQLEQLLPDEASPGRALGAVVGGEYRALGTVAEFDRPTLFELYVSGFDRDGSHSGGRGREIDE